MKFCLSNRQEREYLKKADQIKVSYRDINSIADLILDYPQAAIILDDDNNLIEDWSKIVNLDILAKKGFILRITNTQNIQKAKENGIQFYLKWLINDYELLKTVKKMGVCAVRVAGPLFFDLAQVKQLSGLPAILVPNVAFDDGLIREDGVIGTWIRPEDLKLYKDYTFSVEFNHCSLTQERALYRIYAEKGEWPGDLGMIIQDLNYVGENPLITPLITENRLYCKQKCASGSGCQSCYRALNLANKEKIKQLKKEDLAPHD